MKEFEHRKFEKRAEGLISQTEGIVLDAEQASGKLPEQEQNRLRFEKLASRYTVSEFSTENEDGSQTVITTYEKYIDPSNSMSLDSHNEFRARADLMGLTQTSADVFPTAITKRLPEEHERYRHGHSYDGTPLGPLVMVQVRYRKRVDPPKHGPAF